MEWTTPTLVATECIASALSQRGELLEYRKKALEIGREELALGPLSARRLRLEPPSGLSSREREIFVETVNALPDDLLRRRGSAARRRLCPRDLPE